MLIWGGRLKPLTQLLDVDDLVYSSDKAAVLLKDLFKQMDLKADKMESVQLSQKIKKSIKVIFDFLGAKIVLWLKQVIWQRCFITNYFHKNSNGPLFYLEVLVVKFSIFKVY